MKANHTASVGRHNGRTAIFVDGTPIPGMSFTGGLYAPGYYSQRTFEGPIHAGIPIHFIPWNTGGGDDFRTGWPGPGQCGFRQLDYWAHRVLQVSPEAWLILRLYFSTPDWWAEANPEELVVYSDGEGRPPYRDVYWLRPDQASMASAKWIADVSEVLRALVAHAEDSPYAHRVLGYMVTSGGTAEWVYWGAQQHLVPDCSAPALRYYRTWLRERYGQQDWINAVEVPSDEDRRRGRPGLLRDPKRDRNAVDFELALSEMVADNFIAWCRVVKEATENKRLTGAFFSYLLWQSGLVTPIAANGHLGLRKAMDSPYVDFLTGITSYDNREPGGPGTFMLPVESVQHAGKLVFNEVDTPSHRRAGEWRDRQHPFQEGIFGTWPLRDAEESIGVIRREFAHHLIHGAAWWYFDLHGEGWFDFPEAQEEFRRQSEIMRESLGWDLSSVSEVAGVVSWRSCARHTLFRMHDAYVGKWRWLQCDLATAAMYKTGCPIDWWMTEDLADETLRRYKVLYLYNSTFLTEQERQNVEALKGEGRTLIFVGYPGLASAGGLDAEAASTLVGMKLRLVDSRQPAGLRPANYDHEYFSDIDVATTFGPGAVIGPRLLPEDDDATVLAHWPDGAPAAAVRSFNDWTAIFFPVPPDNAEFLRRVFETAGCHAYSRTGEVIFANRSLLSVHMIGEANPVCLPEPRRVTDLFTGQVVLDGGRRFLPQRPRVFGMPGTTRVYRLE